MEEVIITKFNFEDEVLNADMPVLLGFWATWCGPCRMVAPELELLAKEMGDNLKVGKVNVDDEMELATNYGISVIPTMILIKDKKEVKRTSGYMKKDEIKAFFNL